MVLLKKSDTEVIACLNGKRVENAFLIRTIEMGNASEIKTYGESTVVLEKNSGSYLFSIARSGDFRQLVSMLDGKLSTFYVSNSDYSDEISEVFENAELQNYIQYVLESADYVAHPYVMNDKVRVVEIDTSWTEFILSLYKSKEFGYKNYIDYCIEHSPAFGALNEKGEKIGYVLIHKNGEIGSMVISPDARGMGVGRTLMQFITPEYARLASIGCGFVLPENSCSKKMMEASCFVAAEKQIIWAYI